MDKPSSSAFSFAQLSDPHLTSLEQVRWRQLLNKRLFGYLSWRRKRRHEHRSEVLDARRAEWSLPLNEEQRAQLVGAMTRVVNEPGGTAFPYRPSDYVVAGKTGTAQNPHGEPHSWFVGFGPVDDPRIVIAAIVENGHPDNTVSLAVPLATCLLYTSPSPRD